MVQCVLCILCAVGTLFWLGKAIQSSRTDEVNVGEIIPTGMTPNEIMNLAIEASEQLDKPEFHPRLFRWYLPDGTVIEVRKMTGVNGVRGFYKSSSNR